MRLVVTTWNLQGSKGVDVAAVAGHLRDQGSDLVFLQEVQRRQARRVAGALGARSHWWGFKHWPIRTWSEGMAVVGVTVPVPRARTVALSRRWRFWSFRRRIMQLARTDTGLTLVNVHLSPHDEAAQRRVRELALALRRIGPADERQALLAGDFNSTPDSGLFATLAAAGLVDAWAVGRPGDPGPTILPRRIDRPPRRRIDFIWATAAIEVVAAEVPRFGTPDYETFYRLSDHLPLTVTLDLPD